MSKWAVAHCPRSELRVNANDAGLPWFNDGVQSEVRWVRAQLDHTRLQVEAAEVEERDIRAVNHEEGERYDRRMLLYFPR